MAVSEQVAESQESFQTEDVAEPVPPADIVAYNELRSCADLVRLHASGKLEIQPDFQREVVWASNDRTRFIDSLVKQLPIPSMCFSLDYKTQKWKVIDGLQRMSSIIGFLSGPVMKLTDLADIHPSLRGTTNDTLRKGTEEERRLYALVEDVSIPVTVIRCDYTQQSHMRYLFTIFHRLNSGGVRLTNQEIRNCIYTGPFNDFLKKFDKESQDWKAVARRIWGSMDRFRSIEVLLRVLAFGEKQEAYDGNLARFLNDYMQTHAMAKTEDIEVFEKDLHRLVHLAKAVLDTESRKKLPLALVEALLVGLYNNLEGLVACSADDIAKAYKTLIADEVFSESARYAVSSPENVAMRLVLATGVFKGVC
ncbi:DUF262 domain-containing protein [Luteibacter sp. PPL201]|uniref:DUF262 domain-containing protein n=1 Tax=Luteibacter sahnii TaxID=3021977 RepID=A0ABT6BJZ5_9GAMM